MPGPRFTARDLVIFAIRGRHSCPTGRSGPAFTSVHGARGRLAGPLHATPAAEHPPRSDAGGGAGEPPGGPRGGPAAEAPAAADDPRAVLCKPQDLLEGGSAPLPAALVSRFELPWLGLRAAEDRALVRRMLQLAAGCSRLYKSLEQVVQRPPAGGTRAFRTALLFNFFSVEVEVLFCVEMEDCYPRCFVGWGPLFTPSPGAHGLHLPYEALRGAKGAGSGIGSPPLY